MLNKVEEGDKKRNNYQAGSLVYSKLESIDLALSYHIASYYTNSFNVTLILIVFLYSFACIDQDD